MPITYPLKLLTLAGKRPRIRTLAGSRIIMKIFKKKENVIDSNFGKGLFHPVYC